MEKIPIRVVHYSKHNPEARLGGVEAFARNLGLIFEHVEYMFAGSIDIDRVRDQELMVICDNQWVTDWPSDMAIVGFQHGVAALKYEQTRNRSDHETAARQALAARRPRTIWVACTRWISASCGKLYGNPAEFVIHHPVDLARFDGKRQNSNPRMVLHDARTRHKGARIIAKLAKGFADWSFEPLDCEPHEVPDRMRTARAFMHLSRYEGNSLVCNEAMAMNLPCLVTEVGLMSDDDRPRDVWVVDPGRAFGNRTYLEQQVSAFLGSLDRCKLHTT